MFMLFCIVHSTNMFSFARSQLWSLDLASEFFHDSSLTIFVDKSRGVRNSGMHRNGQISRKSMVAVRIGFVTAER